MRQLRLLLWVAVALAALLLGWMLWRPAPAPAGSGTPGIASGAVTSSPVAASPGLSLGIGGPFTLVGADGKPFASQRLAGRPYAIFFGFTHCPDVCPTTLGRLAKLRRELGKGDGAFQIVFISVDPARDTPQAVGRYAALFDTPIVGLTGSEAQIAAVMKQYGVVAKKVPLENGSYTIDHSASVLLFDRDGQFDSTIALEEGDAPALAKLKRIAG